MVSLETKQDFGQKINDAKLGKLYESLENSNDDKDKKLATFLLKVEKIDEVTEYKKLREQEELGQNRNNLETTESPIGDKNYNAGSNALVDRQMEKDDDNGAIVDFMSDFAIAINKNPNDKDLQLTARLIFFYLYRNRGFEKDGKIAGPEFLQLICPNCNGDLDAFKTEMETIDFSGTEISLASI